MTPLRWAYPKSYLILQEMTSKMGIHAYEYEVRVDKRDMAKPSLLVQRGNQKWVRDFDANDLITAGEVVRRFFDEVLGAIAEESQHAYQDIMQYREV